MLTININNSILTNGNVNCWYILTSGKTYNKRIKHYSGHLEMQRVHSVWHFWVHFYLQKRIYSIGSHAQSSDHAYWWWGMGSHRTSSDLNFYNEGEKENNCSKEVWKSAWKNVYQRNVEISCILRPISLNSVTIYFVTSECPISYSIHRRYDVGPSVMVISAAVYTRMLCGAQFW